ncbi:2-oxoglutarate dehydrogenase, mitochondrial-like isoform X2 [Harmonia axyridis]|uniref:2-oxoglutarate dehydrogenase, mitochondrial-like isoform X2 n=1 Tax=Harmonia axyridis TaxID=115357 RepID=UPI001E275427|nr:2-oxoglutarate dehydrogenase, mitochondrial-like isoform X2 [Harmonia axyridis]
MHSWALFFQNSAAGDAGYTPKHPPAYFSKNEMALGDYLRQFGLPHGHSHRHSHSHRTGSSAQAQHVDTLDEIEDFSAVQRLVSTYQDKGYLAADLDPLGITTKNRRDKIEKWKIDAGFYKRGFENPEKLQQKFRLPHNTFLGPDKMTLKEIIERCEEVYTNRIGVEYRHINDNEKIRWMRQQLEPPGIAVLPKEKKIKLWERLVRTTEFEAFLAKKWASEKRFGIEGCEMLIPAMKEVIDRSTSHGVENYIIGMAHRGRLNTLVNVCRKNLYQLFAHFIGLEAADVGAGDVKYHLGSSDKIMNRANNKVINVSLVANASHLEHVNPVCLGKCRAEQFFSGDRNGDLVMPILIHGDSSFCGQGIVFEAIQLSDLSHFTCKGAVHIIVNNQIGFTTIPHFYRSSPMCTDVAKVINAPIFHVNADDPEAVYTVCKVAADWRKTFKKCVVIDLVGYRRSGHNEIDEPSFTQPLMYKIIRAKPPVLHDYTKRLIAEGVITKEREKQYKEEYDKILEDGLNASRKETHIKLSHWLDSPWTGFFKGKDKYEVKSTGVPEKTLQHIAKTFSSPPPPELKFVTHKGIDRILKQRTEMTQKRITDWSLGEALAIGSLLKEGIHVQFSGQDVERGTFSHRHHVLHHQEIDKVIYNPLTNLYPDQAKYSICNSSLSENAVLGFQLGYSTHDPKCLVIWEAQFGDFANTAQAVIDTFITSGQTKWFRQSGLLMLLPHGFEGMGPEHSSARIERFLELCDDDPETAPKIDDPQFGIKQLHETNVILANVTTPGNLFHIWRRQVYLNFRKPCIIFTPKFILRHPEAQSSYDEMVEGTFFKPIYPDKDASTEAKKLLFCSGKVYYELKEERAKRNLAKDIALVRIEQLCPFPYDLVKKELDKYPDAQIAWVQEEHKFQGPWAFVTYRINHLLQKQKEILYIGRPVSASTASGNKNMHLKELKNFIDEAMKV